MTTTGAARGEAWHVRQPDLAAYCAGQSQGAHAWSVEAHLVQCSHCRARLADLVAHSRLGAEVDRSRGRVLAALPATAAPDRPRRALHPMALRGPWLASVGMAMVLAVVADAVYSRTAGAYPGAAPRLLLLLAPLIPLAGVGLCHPRTADPAGEVVLSTPSAGLKLLLRRTAAVLAIAVPLTAIVGLVGGRAEPTLWLLPTLGLTALVLALSSALQLHRAALVVGGAWGLIIVAPRLLVAPGLSDAAVFGPLAQVLWAAVAVAGVCVVAVRSGRYDRASTRARALGESR